MTESKRFELKLREQNISDEDLLNDLRRVALLLETDSVSGPIYDSYGKYHSRTISKRFGGWNQALDKAGLRILVEMRMTDEQLFFNLLKVWERLGRQPGRRDLCPPLSLGWRRYTNRFGTWNKALIEFVKWANTNEDEPTVGEALQTELADFNCANMPSVDHCSSVGFVHKTKRDINQRLRFRVLLRDGFTCQSCGKSPLKERGIELEVDHKLAWTRGGETVDENLETLCRVCNNGKSNL